MNLFVERQVPSRHWMVVGWVTIFLVGTDLFVVGPFLPAISQDMRVPVTSLTWIVSVFSVTYAVASPVQGRLAERIGTNKVLCLGVALLALGNFLTAISPSVPALLGSRALAGMGAAATSPMLYVLTAEHAGSNRRAADLAIIGSGLLIALVMGAPIGLLVGALSGWREIFVGLAVAFALAVPVNWLTWRTAAVCSPVARQHHPDEAAESLFDAVPYFVAMIFWSSSVYAIYTLLGTALASEYRLEVDQIAGCLAAFGVGATLGSILGGRFADRIGAANATVTAFAAMTVAELVTALVYPLHQTVLLMVSLFAFALFAYGFFPALQASAAQRFVKRRPTVLALLSSSIYVGISFGAAAGGWVDHEMGMQGVIAFAVFPSLAGIWITRLIQSRSAM